jgi:chemotaxis methyl-accepting protein methylase
MAFTFFFRDQQVLERVVEHLLPVLSGRSHPRVWDAGVAMGQEPYTLSIMFAERMGHFAFKNLRIDARRQNIPKTSWSGCPGGSSKNTSNPRTSRDTFA